MVVNVHVAHLSPILDKIKIKVAVEPIEVLELIKSLRNKFYPIYPTVVLKNDTFPYFANV